MTSSYNQPSYFQTGQQYDKYPTSKHYASSNTLNNITPITHQVSNSPPKYGGYQQQLNILSPQSTYKQYQFGDFTSAASKDPYPSYGANNQNTHSYNKPFAPPSIQSGPVSQFLGTKTYVGGQSEGAFTSYQANQAPKPFNDLDLESNKFGQNKYQSSNNPPPSMFIQKKYAFETTSPHRSNYFNVDKYFENFKDPLENMDLSSNNTNKQSQIQTKTIPKSYGTDYTPTPSYSNATTQNQGNVPQNYSYQPIISTVPANKYVIDPTGGVASSYAGGTHTRDKSQEIELQSRVIIDQKSYPPINSQHLSEHQAQREKNKSLVDFQIKNPSYQQPDLFTENLNKSGFYNQQQQQQQQNQQQQQQQLQYQQAQNLAGNSSTVNFDVTLPFADTKKTAPVSQSQQQQQQNFLKDYHEQRKKEQQTIQPVVLKTESVDDQTLFKSKEFYDSYIQLKKQQKEQGFQQFQQNLQEQQFNNQLQQYLQQQNNQKGNILEQFEQKNNKQAINPFKSQTIALYEKARSKMQSQAFLNKITNELDNESVYFIKFLVEQITIDNELDKTRDYIIKTTEFSIQTLFNFFDKKKKKQIDLQSFLDGLESLSIPYIKIYIQRIFQRFLQEDNRNLRYCDFVDIFTQNGKQIVPSLNLNQTQFITINHLGKQQSVRCFLLLDQRMELSRSKRNNSSPYNVKVQNNQFLYNEILLIKIFLFLCIQLLFNLNKKNNLSEDLKKLLSQLFSHLVNIEKSIQSFKDMQGDEENLLKIFKSLDKQQKGYLNISDFLEYLNEKGGDYEKEELIGIFKRLNFITTSGRINFNEFLLSLQRDPVIQSAPEQKQIPEKQNENEQQLKPIKILKEPNMAGFKKITFKGKQKRMAQ